MKLVRILFAFVALALPVSAATIVQTKTYSFVPEDSAPLVFNRFDTSLGTLTSVTITTNVTKSGGSLFVDNESATPASGNINQSVTITLSTSSGVALVDSFFQPIGSGVAATSVYFATVGADDGDGPGVQATGSDYDGTFFGSVSNFQTRSVFSGGISSYEGVGTFVIDANGTQGFNTAAIGGAAVAIDPATVSGDVTITFTYDAVPEPDAALLGLIGSLGLLRRRR